MNIVNTVLIILQEEIQKIVPMQQTGINDLTIKWRLDNEGCESHFPVTQFVPEEKSFMCQG